MKVLILSHMYPNRVHPTNGIFIHNQVKHLVKSGCHVRVVAPVPYAPQCLWFKPKWKKYGEIPDEDVIDGITVYYPRYIALPGTWYHSLTCYSMYTGLRKCVDLIVKDFNPYIIHAHTATYDGYVGLMLKNKYQLPLICSLRGSDIHTYPYYESLTMHMTRRVLREADLIMSVSNKLKSDALNIGLPQKDIIVLYNGCDINTNDYKSEYREINRKKLSIACDDTAVIYVGSIQKDKGVHELMNAFYDLIRRYDNLHLIIIGDGQERGTVEEFIRIKNIGDKIHLLGKLPHQEISGWLKSSDLFVYPSYNEGLPNAVLEAMSCELPVIATRVGGIPEVVKDNETGVLIKSHDEVALSSAIEHIFLNNDVAQEMGRKGSIAVNTTFTWERNAKDMLRIYEEVLDAKN